MIDLHLHTTASDGELSPEKLVDLVLEKGLRAIALTDHDSVGGIAAAIKRAKGKSLEVVPGIEIGCDESGMGFKEVHVLGLFVGPENTALLKFTRRVKQERLEQKKKIVKRLRSLGFDISFGEVKAQAKESLGRPHIAQLLLKKYPGKLAYVDRENKFRVKQAISLIAKANGLSFLAHPGVFRKKDSLQLIEFFQDNGGQGIETYYPYHIVCPELGIGEKENTHLIRFYRETAAARKLLETGGSDFHGKFRETISAVNVPDAVLGKLKEALG
jgi:predicted metal-dependent phosphoesterase TrpH